MPLWEIYHPDSVFTDLTEKKALVDAITAIYAVILPKFYVDIVFLPLPVGSMWRGGEICASGSEPPFVRIVFHHIARNMPPGRSEPKVTFLEKAEAAIKPFIADKGYSWEINGYDTDIHFSRVQGLEFPEKDSELEKLWRKENKPIDPEVAKKNGWIS